MNYWLFSMVQKETLLQIFKVLSVVIFLETEVKGDGCTDYIALSDATRSISYYDSNQYQLCDKTLETKWYRFTGQAGNRMLDYCPTAKKRQCQTFETGWLSGGHPRVLDGEVERKLCFHFYNMYHDIHVCCPSSSTVKVKNCGGYYVYKLDAITKFSCARYCGTTGK